MKFLVCYNDHENKDLHKTVRITAPSKWKKSSTLVIVQKFVKSYNAALAHKKTSSSKKKYKKISPEFKLDPKDVHLALYDAETKQYISLPSDAPMSKYLNENNDATLYVRSGPSLTQAEMMKAGDVPHSQADVNETGTPLPSSSIFGRLRQGSNSKASTNTQSPSTSSPASPPTVLRCARYGCNNIHPGYEPMIPGGSVCAVFGPCLFHRSPPVFLQDTMYWSCCPIKKVATFQDLQQVRGCQVRSECILDEQQFLREVNQSGFDEKMFRNIQNLNRNTSSHSRVGDLNNKSVTQNVDEKEHPNPFAIEGKDDERNDWDCKKNNESANDACQDGGNDQKTRDFRELPPLISKPIVSSSMKPQVLIEGIGGKWDNRVDHQTSLQQQNKRSFENDDNQTTFTNFPSLIRFKKVLHSFGVDSILYDNVIDDMKKDFETLEMDEERLDQTVKNKLSMMLKASFQAVAGNTPKGLKGRNSNSQEEIEAKKDNISNPDAESPTLFPNSECQDSSTLDTSSLLYQIANDGYEDGFIGNKDVAIADASSSSSKISKSIALSGIGAVPPTAAAAMVSSMDPFGFKYSLQDLILAAAPSGVSDIGHKLLGKTNIMKPTQQQLQILGQEQIQVQQSVEVSTLQQSSSTGLEELKEGKSDTVETTAIISTTNQLTNSTSPTSWRERFCLCACTE